MGKVDDFNSWSVSLETRDCRLPHNSSLEGFDRFVRRNNNAETVPLLCFLNFVVVSSSAKMSNSFPL